MICCWYPAGNSPPPVSACSRGLSRPGGTGWPSAAATAAASRAGLTWPAEGGAELFQDADVDGAVGAGSVGPARGAGVDGLGQRVGELGRGQPGQQPAPVQARGQRVPGARYPRGLGGRGQLVAGQLTGQVHDQQRPVGQQGRAVHGQQALPAGQAAAEDVGTAGRRFRARPCGYRAEPGQFGPQVGVRHAAARRPGPGGIPVPAGGRVGRLALPPPSPRRVPGPESGRGEGRGPEDGGRATRW